MSDQWGVGDKKDAKPFDRAPLGDEWVDLIFGEHPHSRSDNRMYARMPCGEVEAFDGHRICTRIEINESNYLKTSELSGDEIRKGGSVKVWMNGLQVYSDFVRSWESGMARARDYINKVFSGTFPLKPWDPDDWKALEGRKVFYREIPSLIDHVIPHQNCVIVVPDGVKAYPPAPWHNDRGDYDEYENRSAKVEVDSPHIWWWRE